MANVVVCGSKCGLHLGSWVFPYVYDAQRVFATETVEKVCSDAVQILGRQGYTRKWPLEKYLRDVRALQICEGTNQIQRIVISSML